MHLLVKKVIMKAENAGTINIQVNLRSAFIDLSLKLEFLFNKPLNICRQYRTSIIGQIH